MLTLEKYNLHLLILWGKIFTNFNLLMFKIHYIIKILSLAVYMKSIFFYFSTYFLQCNKGRYLLYFTNLFLLLQIQDHSTYTNLLCQRLVKLQKFQHLCSNVAVHLSHCWNLHHLEQSISFK